MLRLFLCWRRGLWGVPVELPVEPAAGPGGADTAGLAPYLRLPPPSPALTQAQGRTQDISLQRHTQAGLLGLFFLILIKDENSIVCERINALERLWHGMNNFFEGLKNQISIGVRYFLYTLCTYTVGAESLCRCRWKVRYLRPLDF